MEMIEREKKLKAAAVKPEERGLTPGAGARREVDEKLASVMSVPELKPLSALPQNLTINNQPPRVLFETVAQAGRDQRDLRSGFHHARRARRRAASN